MEAIEWTYNVLIYREKTSPIMITSTYGPPPRHEKITHPSKVKTRMTNFARLVAMHRLKHIEPERYVSCESNMLLLPNREADKGFSLWNVFNTIQENILRGRLEYQVWSKNKKGERIIKSMKTRPIKSVEQKIEMNQFLWKELERLAS